MRAHSGRILRFVLAISFLLGSHLMPAQQASAQGIIQTVAGGKLPAGKATSVVISPTTVSTDSTGNVFIADINTSSICKLMTSSGTIALAAGDGAFGDGGDGGAAIGAQMGTPTGLTFDASGNLFIADGSFNRVRRVDAKTGIITTVAGNGMAGFSGDGGLATSSQLNNLNDVASDAAGNLFLADNSNQRVRRVGVKTGIITTIAGNGTAGFSGDSGPATGAELNFPSGVAVDAGGNLFVADSSNSRVRRVDFTTGIITTVAGNGTFGSGGDGGPAVNAQLGFPNGVSFDALGNLFISDNNGRVRRVDAKTSVIATVAGGGTGGDGGLATNAQVSPQKVSLDAAGNLFIAESLGTSGVRRVDAKTGIITTVAGGGSLGDGGPALSAVLNSPDGVAVDAAGNVFIADTFDIVVRRVDGNTGIIANFAGNGGLFIPGPSPANGDGGPATSASFGLPVDVVLDGAGNLFVADQFGEDIRRIDSKTGIITTVAGNGTGGFSGDGGPALSAELNLSQSSRIAIGSGTDLFIADTLNSRVRRVDPKTGIVTTVAGNGTQGFGGDGGPALSAELSEPSGVAVDGSGNLFIVDRGNFRVRRVDAKTGIIKTLAGNGAKGFSGDGGSATSAELGGIFGLIGGLAVDVSGNVFIVDEGNERIRRVDGTSGIITTIAGNGTADSKGDDGLAASAELSLPFGVTLDSRGNLFIASQGDNRIRSIGPSPAVSLANSSLAFGNQGVNTASSVKSVTLTNSGQLALTIASVMLGGTDPGDFAETDNCVPAVAALSSCSINVTFTPLTTGRRTATLTITDNAPGNPHLIMLGGAGTDFSFGAASGGSTSAAITAGQTATYNLQITPMGGLSGTLNLSCSGAPPQGTCVVSPSALNVSGNSPLAFSVTVTTMARSFVPFVTPHRPWSSPARVPVLLALLALVCILAIQAFAIAHRSKAVRLCLTAGFLLVCLGCLAACGGGGGEKGAGQNGTPAGTYNLTVTGTQSGSSSHVLPLTLTVN
jgi:sugar lactone lactonase YvrE